MSVLLGLAVDNAPILGRTQALGNLFQHGEVLVVRAGGELAKGNGRVPNVRTAGDMCIQKFGSPSFG